MDPDRTTPTCTTAPAPRDREPATGDGTAARDHPQGGRLRRLGARIGEAVRAAHAASVPF